MDAIRLPALEPRLAKSFGVLLQGFGRCGPGGASAAAGLKRPSFSQKLHRFCRSEGVRAPALIDPLLDHVRGLAETRPVLLAVHDWSTLAFGSHASKRDRRTLTHETDVGYDLAAVLMVDGATGDPLAPASVSLSAEKGMHSTRVDLDGRVPKPHVDQVLDSMEFTRGLKLAAPVVHVVDREADSVGHWRAWTAAGHTALVRADDRIVLEGGEETTLERIADGFAARGEMQESRAVLFRGRPARQFTAEAEVVLHRPAKRREGGKQTMVKGEPVALRFVAAEVRGLDGKRLARWLLLTNAPTELADAAQVAEWYYFRWRIETMYKTLKSGGYDLEEWLQRSGERLLRKLMIALTALVCVWDLERKTDEESQAFKLFLMNLSGRQTKRRKPVTTNGLLAGLWVFQQMARHAARAGPDPNAALLKHLPQFATPPPLNEDV